MNLFCPITPRMKYPLIFPSLYFPETSLHDRVADSYCESGRNNFGGDLTHRGSPREPVESKRARVAKDGDGRTPFRRKLFRVRIPSRSGTAILKNVKSRDDDYPPWKYVIQMHGRGCIAAYLENKWAARCERAARRCKLEEQVCVCVCACVYAYVCVGIVYGWYGIAAAVYRFRVAAVTRAEVQTPPFTADGAVLPSWLRWFPTVHYVSMP